MNNKEKLEALLEAIEIARVNCEDAEDVSSRLSVAGIPWDDWMLIPRLIQELKKEVV
jgi:hypothetical protein